MMATMFSLITNAQTALQTTKVLDNTYIGINGGVTTPMSLDKALPLNPTFGIRVGKDFTPVIGINVEGTTWFGSNFDLKIGKNIFRAVNVGVNPTINLTNLFKGYNGSPRKLEFITVTGLGWLHNFGNSNNYLTSKMAIDMVWNPCSFLSFYIEPGVFWNLNQGKNQLTKVSGFYDKPMNTMPYVIQDITQYNKVQFAKNGAQLFVNVGITYKFKTSNGTHNFKLYNISDLNNEINSLRNELNKKPTEIIKTKTNTVVNNVGTYVIFFAQGSSELSNDALRTLDKIKGDVIVEGFASPEGSPEFNQTLSEERAKVVTTFLKLKKVNVIESVGRGATSNTSNRVVIVTNK